MICFFVIGAGDDTRAWGPPFVGQESAYFISDNRNKKVCYSHTFNSISVLVFYLARYLQDSTVYY